MNHRILFAGSLALVLAVTTACGGNDARRCKVSTEANGDVRVSCPGRDALVIPAGAPGGGGPADECETHENPETGEVLLTCQGSTVSLGYCGFGYNGDLYVGDATSPNAIVPPTIDRRTNAQELERFVDRGCTRALGTIVLGPDAGAYTEFLGQLEFATDLQVQGDGDAVSLPVLEFAAISVEDVSYFDRLSRPVHRFGGVEFHGGTYEGTVLTVDHLEDGVVGVNTVEGDFSVSVPALKRGSLLVRWSNGANGIDAPLLTDADAIEMSGLPLLGSVDFPELTRVRSIYSYDTPRLTELTLPKLVSGSVSVSNAPLLVTLDLPIWENGGLYLAYLSSMTDFAAPGLKRVSSLRVASASELLSLAFPMLTDASWISLDSLTALESLDFTKLRSVVSDFYIAATGSAGAGLGVELNALQRAKRLVFTEGNIAVINIVSLRSVPEGVWIQRVGELVRVGSPNLTNTPFFFDGVAGMTELVSIDLSSFNYQHGVPSYGDGEIIRGGDPLYINGGGASLDLDLDEASCTGVVHLENFENIRRMVFGSGFTGDLLLKDVTEGVFAAAQFDLSAATRLRGLHLENVSHQGELSDLSFTGDHLRSLTIVDAGVRTVTSDMTDGLVRISDYELSVEEIHLPALASGEVSVMASYSLNVLDLSSFAAGIVSIFADMGDVAGFQWLPSPDVTGEIFVPSYCDMSLAADWPNVSYNGTCT